MRNLDVRSQVDHIFTQIRSRYRKHVSAGMVGIIAGAEFLLEKSLEVVPQDTTALHSTGRVEVHGNTAQVVYGGKSSVVGEDGKIIYVDYALYVHEDLAMHHAPGKQAKFLEAPARRYEDQIKRIVREKAQRHIKHGGGMVLLHGAPTE